MEQKLKKPPTYNFKATDPQIAYLTPASEADMNTSAIIGTERVKPYRQGHRSFACYLLKAKIPGYFNMLKRCL